MKTDDLIKRARRLAETRKYATPGPWKLFGDAALCGKDGQFIFSVYEADLWNANKHLIAAAPEIASLLDQLADRLESSDRADAAMCEALNSGDGVYRP